MSVLLEFGIVLHRWIGIYVYTHPEKERERERIDCALAVI